MKAIILAAGRGSRMGDNTDEHPKCLVELAGIPLLIRQVAALRRGGVSEIGIVRGYRADAIDVPGAKYFHNQRWADTNMVMSLLTASSWLAAGPTLVSYSDIFYRHELVRRLAAAAGDLAISYDRRWLDLWKRRFTDPLSDAETFRIDASGRLIEIGGKTSRLEDIEGQYMGLLRFTPTAWAAVEAELVRISRPARDRLDMTSLLRRLIDSGTAIYTVATEGDWGEIDNPSDVLLYEKMSAAGEVNLEG